MLGNPSKVSANQSGNENNTKNGYKKYVYESKMYVFNCQPDHLLEQIF